MQVRHLQLFIYFTAGLLGVLSLKKRRLFIVIFFINTHISQDQSFSYRTALTISLARMCGVCACLLSLVNTEQ